jgi:hypothetical protein
VVHEPPWNFDLAHIPYRKKNGKAHLSKILTQQMVLLFPVATINVERAFSVMSFVKSKLRNKMGVSLLDDCLQSNTNGLSYICLFVSNFSFFFEDGPP